MLYKIALIMCLLWLFVYLPIALHIAHNRKMREIARAIVKTRDELNDENDDLDTKDPIEKSLDQGNIT